MTQPSIVQLTRYIRPKLGIRFHNDEVDPQQGVTLQIELDYARRLIYVQYAICNHDNGEPSFNKRVGVQIACARIPVILPMWEGPAKLEGTDLTEYVVAGLNAVAPFGVSHTDLRRINKMYNKAGPRVLNKGCNSLTKPTNAFYRP